MSERLGAVWCWREGIRRNREPTLDVERRTKRKPIKETKTISRTLYTYFAFCYKLFFILSLATCACGTFIEFPFELYINLYTIYIIMLYHLNKYLYKE